MMRKTRIKMCGFTRVADIQAAAAVGVDAIGFVFYEKSARNVSVQQAVELANVVPPFISTVGLFVDAKASEVQAALQQVKLSLLQFHGGETADYCEQFCKPYLKVIRISSAETAVDTIYSTIEQHPNANGFLLDTYSKNSAGGTGESFTWSVIPQDIRRPIVLAGGLTASNVQSAIERVNPYAVDISSGIESAPGIKDKQLMASFAKNVYLAGSECI